MRYTAKNHIAFDHLASIHNDIIQFKQFFAFCQRKWSKVNASCNPVMKSFFIREKVRYNPRRGRSAGDQHQILLRRCPTIPEIIKRTFKIRAGRIHPRKFIKKYDSFIINRFTIYLIALKQFLKTHKSLKPIYRYTFFFISICIQACLKSTQLSLRLFI